MLAGSILFVLGFAFVFVAYGSLFGALGDWLYEWRRHLTIVLGSLTIVLGLVFMGGGAAVNADVTDRIGRLRSAWPPRHCWECCSRWAGHPA